MKTHGINALNNFMGGWYIDESVCDDLILYHKNNPDKIIGATGGFTETGHTHAVNKSVKDSTDVVLKFGDVATKYFAELQSCTNEYIKLYPYSNYYAPWLIWETVNLQYYAPGGGYHAFHTERVSGDFPVCNRHMVFMTYLNDVTDGGETEFFHQNIKVKPEKGLTIIWPADWTFTHRGITSHSQEKYIATGWFSYASKTNK
jgi:hypothetical protein